MTTCRCCGQPVNVQATDPGHRARTAEQGRRVGTARASGAADAVWVDEALMACCNAAYEAAAARGAGQVEIAHFLFAAARMDPARDWFASASISTERLASLLVGEMRGRYAGALPSRGRDIETSSQLQALIYRAREDGLRRGLSSISVADVLGVLVAQADALGMRDRLSAWLAASAIVRSADGGAERGREAVAQFARVSPSMRETEGGRAAEWRPREWSGVRPYDGRKARVADDLARDAASSEFARRHEPPVSRDTVPVRVPRGYDEQLLIRLEARLAEQDRALRAVSEQLARVEAAARAEALARQQGRLTEGGTTGRTQRGYRASASRWRQRKRGGFIGAGRGSGIASRSGRSAVAGSPDGSRDGSADRSRRGGGDGSGGGSGRGNGFGHASAGSGGGLGSGAGRGRASGSAGGSGSDYGTGNPSPGNGAKGTAGPATSGLSNGAGASGPSGSPGTGRAKSGGSGSGSGSASGNGTGKPSGSRKSRGRRASGHAPRDRYGRMRLLRQRLSSWRRLRNSREDESERDDYRAARLPRERDASVSRTWEPPAEHGSVDAREERDASALTHDGSHGTSWARAPWSERTPHPHSARAATAHDEADEVTADDDDGETREKRFYLALDDDVVAAPSIGPRTAGRLIPNGIITVRDLLACDAEDLAAQVTARHITADRIRAWQAQARLVCTIPWLRGTHAQLLVGAGYLSADEIVADTPDGVCAAILAFAASREGQSVLRSGEPPQMERLLKWVEHAGMAEPERAELAA